MKINKTRLCLATLSLIVLTSCSSFYRPANEIEKIFLKQSKVRVDRVYLESNVGKSELLGVAGIILEVKNVERDNKQMLEIIVDHRDFDWIWNSGGITFKNYYLSPDSDGKVLVRVLSENVENLIKIEKDNMLVFYGRPMSVVVETVVFDADYVRAFNGFQYGVSGFYYPNRKTKK